MNKPNMTHFFKGMQRTLTKHSPEILTGIGIAGMVTSTVLAVKATPKALRNCEIVKAEKEEPKKLDYVKATWKCYIPAAVTGVVSTACLIGASSVNLKRNAALATAYQISQTAITEYRDKVIETVGEETEKVVREKVAEEKVKKNPSPANEVIMVEGEDFYCLDTITGRYFRSTKHKIEDAVIDVNNRLWSEMYISLNEFYDMLGLPRTRMGDELGWTIEDGKIEAFVDSIVDEKGRPVLVLDYNVSPRYNFSKIAP